MARLPVLYDPPVHLQHDLQAVARLQSSQSVVSVACDAAAEQARLLVQGTPGVRECICSRNLNS